jgi:hypothetical protein
LETRLLQNQTSLRSNVLMFRFVGF